VHGTVYKHGSVAESLYEFSGGSQDWVRDHTRIKYSYLVELRPSWPGTFCVGFNQILPAGQEIFEGVKVVAKAVQGKLKLNGRAWKRQLAGQGYEPDGATVISVDLKMWLFSSIFVMILQKLV